LGVCEAHTVPAARQRTCHGSRCRQSRSLRRRRVPCRRHSRHGRQGGGGSLCSSFCRSIYRDRIAPRGGLRRSRIYLKRRCRRKKWRKKRRKKRRKRLDAVA
jgi:hypothetical protein